MSRVILLFLLLFNIKANALNVGFNQAWFKNDYQSQFLDEKFDSDEVRRVLELAKGANSKTVRIWLFEGARFEYLNWQDRKMISIKPEVMRNFVKLLKIASENDLSIYLTLFDAHAYIPSNSSFKEMLRFKKLLQLDNQKEFFDKVLDPLLSYVKKHQLLNVISKIDIINEADTLVNRGVFPFGWLNLSKLLCFYQSKLNIPVTASIRWHGLLPMPINIFSDNGPLQCADFVDLHSYSSRGKILNCNRIQKLSKRKEVVLGEFGQSYFDKEYSDLKQLNVTASYIEEAKRCGFTEALAWRLSDIREGHNKEARYSFEAFGMVRPAYSLIQQNNLE